MCLRTIGWNSFSMDLCFMVQHSVHHPWCLSPILLHSFTLPSWPFSILEFVTSLPMLTNTHTHTEYISYLRYEIYLKLFISYTFSQQILPALNQNQYYVNSASKFLVLLEHFSKSSSFRPYWGLDIPRCAQEP